MLVLSRKPGEEVVVPHLNLVFTILQVRGNKVRLGITAPPNTQVHRREVWERIQASPAMAEAAAPSAVSSHPNGANGG